MSKEIEQSVAARLAPSLEQAGYDLVRVMIKGSAASAVMQIMADRLDGQGMTVEDCATISRLTTELLDADKDLADKYDLEASSPGIDRPLVRLKDYDRYQGHVAKLELAAPLDGVKRFQGKIARVAGDMVELKTDKGDVQVPFAAIDKAKLVMTDELLKAAASGRVTH